MEEARDAKSAKVTPRARGSTRSKQGMAVAVSVGKIVDDPQVDSSYPVSITRKCNLPMIHDFDGEDIIAVAGDFVIVNCKKSSVCSAFEIDKTFEITQGGCLAALVCDWTNDHPNVLVRRQLANDKWDQCSDPVETFSIEHVGTIENHLLDELRSHAFLGFHFTSSDFSMPFVITWFSALRRNANNSGFL